MVPRTSCPNCGNALKPGALSCPHCGSDEQTGWSESAGVEHPEVAPFDADDYEELHAREFGTSKPSHMPKRKPELKRKDGVKPFPWIEFLIGLGAMLFIMLRVYHRGH